MCSYVRTEQHVFQLCSTMHVLSPSDCALYKRALLKTNIHVGPLDPMGKCLHALTTVNSQRAQEGCSLSHNTARGAQSLHFAHGILADSTS